MKKLLLAPLLGCAFLALSQGQPVGRGFFVDVPGCLPATPAAPTVVCNDNNNTITVSHTLGASEIVYSVNGGAYQPYLGTISVGDVNLAANYYRFKIKSATCRNESLYATSVAFTASGTSPPPSYGVAYGQGSFQPENITNSGGLVTAWGSDFFATASHEPAYVANAINGFPAVALRGGYMNGAYSGAVSRFTYFLLLKMDAEAASNGPVSLFTMGPDRPGLFYSVSDNSVQLEGYASNKVVHLSLVKEVWTLVKFEVDNDKVSLSSNTNVGSTASITAPANIAYMVPTLGQPVQPTNASTRALLAYFSYFYGPRSPAENSTQLQTIATKFGLTVNPAVLSNATLPYYTPTLKLKDAAGNMQGGQNTVTLTTAPQVDYEVGDPIIIETGGEAATGNRAGGEHGTSGVGGQPYLQKPTVAALNADATVPIGALVYVEENNTSSGYKGGCLWYKTSASASARVTWGGYYQNYATPFALWATVTAVSGDGLTLTLDKPAVRTTTGANVFYDNYPALQAALTNKFEISLPGGGPYKVSRQLKIAEYKSGVRLLGNTTTLVSPKGCEEMSLVSGAEYSYFEGLILRGNGKKHGCSFPRETYPVYASEIANQHIFTPGFSLVRHHNIGRHITVYDNEAYFLKSDGSYNLLEDCAAIKTEGDMDYAGWMVHSDGGAADTFRRVNISAGWMSRALEFFRGTGTVFEGCNVTNGLFASNSVSDCILRNSTFTFTANCHPVTSPVSVAVGGVFSWNPSGGNPVLDINATIAAQSGQSGTAGSTELNNVSITFQGYVGNGVYGMRGFVFSNGTPSGRVINCSYTAPALPSDYYYVYKALVMDAMDAYVDNFVINAPGGIGPIAQDNNGSISITMGNASGQIKNTSCKYLEVQDGVNYSQNVSYEQILVRGTPFSPAPPAGSFVQKMATAAASPTFLWNEPGGINEFDILYENGEFHWFYDDKGSSVYRHATTIAGLQTATSYRKNNADVRFPTVVYDAAAGLWHLWGLVDYVTVRHFTASTAQGLMTATQVGDVGIYDGGNVLLSRFDMSVRKRPQGGWIAAYVMDANTAYPRKIRLMYSTDLVNWTEYHDFNHPMMFKDPYTYGNLSVLNWKEDSDPCAFYDPAGKLTVLHGGFDGKYQSLGCVTVDETTGYAETNPYQIRKPALPWELLYGQYKIFNPVYLRKDNLNYLFYSKNTQLGQGPDGWAYTTWSDN